MASLSEHRDLRTKSRKSRAAQAIFAGAASRQPSTALKSHLVERARTAGRMAAGDLFGALWRIRRRRKPSWPSPCIFRKSSRTELTAPGLLVQEAILMFAALAAAAIMGVLEGRPFGIYGLPGTAAFGARFWQGIVWGLGDDHGDDPADPDAGRIFFRRAWRCTVRSSGATRRCGDSCFSASVSLKNSCFADTRNSRWLRESDSGPRRRCYRRRSALFIWAMAVKTKWAL